MNFLCGSSYISKRLRMLKKIMLITALLKLLNVEVSDFVFFLHDKQTFGTYLGCLSIFNSICKQPLCEVIPEGTEQITCLSCCVNIDLDTWSPPHRILISDRMILS